MTFHDDPDLERRLRRIAETPEPPIPGSVYRYASEVTTRERGRSMRSSMNPFKATVFATAGLAAAVVIAIAATGVLLTVRGGGVGGQTASPSPTAIETAVASPTIGTSPSAAPQSAEPTRTAGPTASPYAGQTLMAGGFKTPGITNGWTGFTKTAVSSSSTSFPTRIVQWRGGYLATSEYRQPGPANGLWTSPDGETWTPVTGIGAGNVFVSVAPGGLVAVGVTVVSDVPTATGDVWTSSDGITWHDAGKSKLPGTIISMAGTTAGVVATVDVTTAAGKGVTDNYQVLFSTDGVNWTRESAAGGIPVGSSQVPHVQSGNGRFFLMEVPGPIATAPNVNAVLVSSTSPHDVTLWSDDGRTWTKCGGEYTGLATKVDFGRDGLLMETNLGSVPGGMGLARSADGGKTWQVDANFGPLGAAQCTGECGVGGDGQIVSNGTYFLAVKSDGSKAWLSYDARTWTPVPWGLGSIENGTIVLFPRGVSAATYGAAK